MGGSLSRRHLKTRIMLREARTINKQPVVVSMLKISDASQRIIFLLPDGGMMAQHWRKFPEATKQGRNGRPRNAIGFQVLIFATSSSLAFSISSRNRLNSALSNKAPFTHTHKSGRFPATVTPEVSATFMPLCRSKEGAKLSSCFQILAVNANAFCDTSISEKNRLLMICWIIPPSMSVFSSSSVHSLIGIILAAAKFKLSRGTSIVP
mmetsp:Transcript_12090/g.25980  ORF Transcript_12090/g.25980 Transcript_12090/m.25980 type:complete len:208 (+) Transcript_12090:617-1240(+)